MVPERDHACGSLGYLSIPFPEATEPASSRTEVFLRYLTYFRDGVVRRIEAMSEDEVRRSRVLSGWTPLELVRHLQFMERRWFVWGFEGEAVDDPFGDQVDGRWVVPDGLGVPEVLAEFRRQAALSDAVLRRHGLDEVGRPSEWWAGAARAGPAARHAGVRAPSRPARHRGRARRWGDRRGLTAESSASRREGPRLRQEPPLPGRSRA